MTCSTYFPCTISIEDKGCFYGEPSDSLSDYAKVIYNNGVLNVFDEETQECYKINNESIIRGIKLALLNHSHLVTLSSIHEVDSIIGECLAQYILFGNVKFHKSYL